MRDVATHQYSQGYSSTLLPISASRTYHNVLPALNLDKIDRTPARFVPVGNLRDARLRFERDYISAVLQYHGWRMGEAAQAAAEPYHMRSTVERYFDLYGELMGSDGAATESHIAVRFS